MTKSQNVDTELRQEIENEQEEDEDQKQRANKK